MTASAGLEPSKIIPYVPNVTRACELAGVPELKRILVQRRSYRENDFDSKLYMDYEEEMATVSSGQGHEVVGVEGTHPFFILYTSGTTGAPKGIYRSHGGMLAAWNYSMKYIYDIQKKDVMFATSDIGWIVGHVFIVYAPLVRGGTIVMSEGKPVGTPNAGVVWRMCEDYRVKSLFIAPTGIRGIKKEDYDGEFIKQHDLSSLKSINFGGERCDPETVKWLQKHFPDKHMNDNWWQTETGWMVSTNYMNLTTFPTKLGSATKPAPGWDVRIMDDEDMLVEEPDKIGRIMVKLPCPPGHMDGLWENDQGYIDKYLTSPEGYYLTGDAGYFDADGYTYVMTRTDELINTAGHRISTGRIEEVLAEHTLVAECAVVGKDDPLRGDVPFAYVVVQRQADRLQLAKDLQALVREKVGAFAKLDNVIVIKRLPKTRSGKILRNLLRDIANEVEKPRIAPTIEDRDIVPEI